MAYSPELFEGGIGGAARYDFRLQGPVGQLSFPTTYAGGVFDPTDRLGLNMGYYSGGFLPAGGGQISGGGLLDSITGLITNVGLPIIKAITGGAAGPIPSGVASTSFALPATVSRTTGAVERVAGAITRSAEQHPVLTAAGGAAATAGAAAVGIRTMRGRKRPTVTMHPDGTVRVHHRRRMNVCNIHALRRALRRAHGFERVVRRVMHFVAPHKQHRAMVFKKRRRRA